VEALVSERFLETLAREMTEIGRTVKGALSRHAAAL
jgi:hypothetical protein